VGRIIGPISRGKRIVVTGAGGLIGGELVGRLAERGHAVIAVVHSKLSLHRAEGASIPARDLGDIAPSFGEVCIVAGDIRRERLGVDDASYVSIITSTDLIVHCAAAAEFGLPEDIYQAVNVDGTASVLALAAAARPRPADVLHVSTAYVCGERSGPIAEEELDAGQTFANRYEASKAEAERLVYASAGRAGRVVIARPSIVVGRWRDGAIRTFNSIYLLIRLVVEGRIRSLPVAPGASLDLVPIDHVAHALVDLAEQMEVADGRTFHLVSGSPVTFQGLTRLAERYPAIRTPRFVAPEDFDLAALRPAERRVHAQVLKHYASYLRRDPRFRDDNTRALLGYGAPDVDLPFLVRMMDHAISSGFLPGLTPASVAAQRTSG
jgi:nucleoside-diphosphate-sugar epimerase